MISMHHSPARSVAVRTGVAALIVVVLSGAVPAGAQPAPVVRPEARSHFEQGLRLYRAKAFRAAAGEFEVTYKLDPNRDVLYVWAQALRLAGDCAAAVALYERFLAAGPPKRESEVARTNMARCQPAPTPGTGGERSAPPASPTESAGAVPPTSPPSPTTTATNNPPPALSAPTVSLPPPAAGVVVAPMSPAAEPRTFSSRSKLLNRLLLGSGTAAVAVGGAFYLSARSERDAGRAAMSYPELEQHAENARYRDRVAWGALAVGSTLIVAGIVHYVLR